MLHKWEGQEKALEDILREKFNVPGVMTLSPEGIDLHTWLAGILLSYSLTFDLSYALKHGAACLCVSYLFINLTERHSCLMVSPEEVFPQLVSIGRKDKKIISPKPKEHNKNLPFFVVDLRSPKEMEAGKFGKAWPFDPEKLADAEEITTLLEILTPMKDVHVAIMSSYGTLLEVNAMVMHLYCKGFKVTLPAHIVCKFALL
jgi:hypothetical protein